MASTAQLKQTIQSQFGLEILLKHQELRLIEQELAKCQTAYEQLRRCTLVPYEKCGSTSPTALNAQASRGANLSTDDSSWRTPPAILNGPYTRHYSKWLIPDPRFDGETAQAEGKAEMSQAGKRPMEGRTTRGSFADKGSKSGKSRGRGIAGSTNTFAPSPSTAQAKDKAGPLVLKRSSDGQMVKLVCLDCDRGDFSSAQGFINHCRIAHHRGFESHDAAANACGQAVEFDETGQVIDEGDPGSAGTVALVHPLIRLAPTTRPPPVRRPKNKLTGGKDHTTSDDESVKESKADEWQKARNVKIPQRSKADALRAPITPSADFVSSPQTPHLSALMKAQGHDGDLGKMVGEAQIQYDFGGDSSSDEEDDEEGEDARGVGLDGSDERPHSRGSTGGSRMPARAGVSPAPLGHSGGSKGVERSRKPGHTSEFFSRPVPSHPVTTPTPSIPTRSRPQRRQVEEVTVSPVVLSPPNLSPNTLDPTTAPSLVSDDGEYEAHSESEALDSEEADEAEYGVEFDVEEGDDMGGSDGTAATDPDLAHGSSASPKEPVPRRTALRRGTSALGERRVGREQRHVSFVSPVTEPEVKGRGARRGARK